MKREKVVFKSIVVCLLTLSIFSCNQKDFGGDSLKLDKVNTSILDYLKSNSSYSILTEGLEITGLSAKVGLYGNMTMFVPANIAFTRYFEKKNIPGLSAMNIDTLKRLLSYHIYNQKFGSGLFQTGSLPAVTASGDLIKMDITQGIRKTLINNTITIDTMDLLMTNGVIHVVSDVIEPPDNTIASYLAAIPDYSIMSEAVKNTGLDTGFIGKVLYDNTMIVNGLPAKKWTTAFIETNAVLNHAGINSFDDLAKRYSNHYSPNKVNYSDPTDSLNIFMRYHCMQQRFFLSDFRNDYMQSKSTGNWLIFDTQGGFTINKRDKIQINVIPATSNVVANNGIIHAIDTVLAVYTPKPVIVRCYFGGAPEDRVITLIDGITVSTFKDQFSKIGNKQPDQQAIWWLKWNYSSAGLAIQLPEKEGTPYRLNPAYPNDAVYEVMDGIKFNSANGLWIQLTTKPIFAGKYALYLYESSRHTDNNNWSQQWRWLWSFDGVKFPDMVNSMGQFDAFGNDVRIFLNDLDGQNINNGLVWQNYNMLEKRELGVFTFTEIKSHKIEFTMVDQGKSQIWYKIQFEPVL